MSVARQPDDARLPGTPGKHAGMKEEKPCSTD